MIDPDDRPTPDPIIRPPYYRAGGYELNDIIDAFGLNWRLGNVAKYVFRAGKKGDAIEDLKKARHYLDGEIVRLEKERKGS